MEMVSGSGMARARREFSAKFRKMNAHAIAERFAIDGLAFQQSLGGFHDRAHLLDGIRAGFGDGLGDRRVHFRLAGAGRKIRFDDGELFGFFRGEFQTVAFGELIDRLLALFYERLQDLNRLGLVERAYLFDFLVLDGGLDSSQNGEARMRSFCSYNCRDAYLTAREWAANFDLLRGPGKTCWRRPSVS